MALGGQAIRGSFEEQSEISFAMGKRTVYTKITALPSNIPRQLALDMLHSHEEVIKLNPLVTGVKGIEAPRDSRSDEFFSSWYEISEIITWGFGLRKKISFKGCFHNQPWGLQSHVYAPMGVDMRNKYTIGGNQPGEEREARELGVQTPLDGLYLREDVEIVCGVPLTTSFVKKEAMAATGIMIDRMTRKAELIDAGKLHAMFQDGMLKTAKPDEDPTFANHLPPGTPRSSEPSPGLKRESTFGTLAPNGQEGFGRYHDVVARNSSTRSSTYVPQYQQPGYQGPNHARGGAEMQHMPEVMELPGDFYQPNQHPNSPGLYPPPLKPQSQQMEFRAELPGDFVQSTQTTPNLPNRAASTSSSSYSPSGAGGDYKVANPTPQQPQAQHPAYRQTPPGNQQEFQQPLQPRPHSGQQPYPGQRPNSGQYPQQPSPGLQQYPQQPSPGLQQYPGQQAQPYPGQQPYPVQRRQSGQQPYPTQQPQPPYPGQQLDPRQQQPPPSQQPPPGPYRQPSSNSVQSSDPRQLLPSQRNPSATSTQQVADWQRGISGTNLADPNNPRNSNVEPDHQRFSQMSVQSTPPQLKAQLGPAGAKNSLKCPVCGLFEGDEAAITHHVSKSHFA
ncbi:hypothetical protein LTS10_012668 [Elasticomyces elasticus]|nr:hypothetical protein LTS10_012668 [Elasticomyces elasticus]